MGSKESNMLVSYDSCAFLKNIITTVSCTNTVVMMFS